MSQKIINGDSAEELKKFTDDSIDAVITDPPYGIEFLAKEWDRNTGAVEIWQECLRVLKPGGYLLAFSAARTYHHLATNIESVGFEIRDQIMWLYASGFPKAQDIGKAIERREGKRANAQSGDKWINSGNGTNTTTCSMCGKTNVQIGIAFNCQNEDCEFIDKLKPADNEWSGWKTALKPAHEPICMARKPFRGSTIDNVLKHGVGALNIDATRIASTPERIAEVRKINAEGGLPAADGIEKYGSIGEDNSNKKKQYNLSESRYPSNVLGEVAGYQKYFYCPKVSRRERHRGFEQEHIPDPLANYSQGDVKNHPLWDPSIGTNIQRLKHKILEHEKTLGQEHRVEGAVGNNHPTVKPVALMRYLVKLVTAEGAHIVDPFTGSGSTGMACRELGRSFTGIDLDKNYCEIATRRIDASQEDKAETLFE